MRIGLTYDLRADHVARGLSSEEAAEFDEVETIDALDTAVRGLGFESDRIGHVQALVERLARGDRWDLVLNIAEGLAGFGREAQVPALLEAYGIPHVFSDTLVCALTLHKGMTKDVVRAAGVATPDYRIVRTAADAGKVGLDFPLFAKPVAEGTGKGISANSKISSRAQLQRVCRQLLKEYPGQPVLVERFLPGREFTVGILGSAGDATALATLEILLLDGADAEVYSYRNKDEYDQLVQYRLLAGGKLRRQIEALALNAWRALGCRDAGRIDIRLDEYGDCHFLEVNPLAGIHPQHSDLPIMARLAGMDYGTLIGLIMASALQRCGKSATPVTHAA